MNNDSYKNYIGSSEYIISPKTNNNYEDYHGEERKISKNELQHFPYEYKIDDQYYKQAKARKKIIGHVKESY